MVSPIVIPSTPATAMMSPSVVSVMSVRFSPENENSFVIFVFCNDPSSLAMANVFAGVHRAVENTSNGQPPQVIAVIEIGHQDLQRARRIACRVRESSERWFRTAAADFRRRPLISSRRGPSLGIGVQNREIQLLFFGVEIDEEVIDLVQHFLRARIGAVNLIDHQDRRQDEPSSALLRT